MKSKVSSPVLAACLFGILLCLPLRPASAAPSAERVFITEVMAANTRTLLDRDREYSDWIELYNGGNDAVNLNGWSLTDDRAKPNQWRFPAVSIGPGEYLVVFASGKNRRAPGVELHTNFKLSADGEYLGLIKSDGKTVAMEFSPRFPRQIADASFGLSMGSPNTVLLGENAPKKVLVPTADVGMSWLTPGFNDSKWTATTKGIGFDERGIYSQFLGLDLKQAMSGRNSSAYVRIPFTLTNSAYESMTLRVRYDDGFVAYLNGWEVARANAPAKVAWNATATTGHGSAVPIAHVERFDAGNGRYWTYQLNQSTKPKEHPRTPGATDRYLRLVNGQMANQVNTVAFPSVGGAESDSVAIDLDYRFTGTGEGTERLGFLLIPTATHGTEGPGLRVDSVRDPNLPGIFAVQLLHNPENGQNALTVHWDGSKRTTLDIPSATFQPRTFHHAKIMLEKTPEGVQARIALTADVATRNSGAPATTTVALPGMKLGGQRLELSGRIGNWDQTIDVDNIQFQAAGAAGLIGEEFDLTPHLSALKEGENILGFQALNRSASDTNFFLLPELMAGTSAVRASQPLFLSEPTPGAANRNGFSTMAPPPVFTTRGGVFKESVKVGLAAKEGLVRYTVDGSDPNLSSAEYREPLVLNRTTLLKARTFLPESAPSPIVLETFTITEPNQAATSSGLPIIVINTFGRYISPNNKSAISIRFINTRNGRASLTDAVADYDGRATANVRGFSTLRQPKTSMTVRLRDENGDKVKSGLFGLPKESDWVLYAPYSDKTLIRDALAYEISNGMGRYAPRTRFVELYIDRNGGRLNESDYAGVYVLVERITTGKNRLDITPVGPDDNQEPNISGGYVFKRDHSDRYEAGFRALNSRYFYVEPKGNEITREQSAWLSSYVSQFERALQGPDFRDPDRGYARYLDVDAFIDQHWLIETTKNIDGFRYSAYLHKPRGGKLTMGPAWDWNLSFGNANYHDGDDPRGWYTDMLRDSEISWFRRLSEDPEFMQRTIDRWAELRRGVFSPSRILRRIDEMAVTLNEAQARNFRRWPIMGRSIHPNAYVGSTYQAEINWMKEWITKRIDWIDNQFTKAPVLKLNGNSATLSGAGQIYYTVDGSDPRAVGGKPAAGALAYKGAVSLRGDQVLRARSRRGDSWSGVTSNRDKHE